MALIAETTLGLLPKVGLVLVILSAYRSVLRLPGLSRRWSWYRVRHREAATGDCWLVCCLVTLAQKFYVEHTDDIISLDVNPNPKFGTVIATGQIGDRPQICVWDTTSLQVRSVSMPASNTRQTLSTLRGEHEKGISCLNFSSSGKLLVAVGLGDDSM